MATAKNRAPFSADLQPLRETLVRLLSELQPPSKPQAQSDWYCSIYFERKTSQTFVANLKQTQISDQVKTGVVLRIYNGYTLFEQATDDLAPESLTTTARKFAKRVAATPVPDGAIKRPYLAPSWAQRLAHKLEAEITSQIPNNVTASTPVHFGISFIQDPKALTATDRLDLLKARVERCRAIALEQGMKAGDLTFVSATQGFWQEEAIFIDQETNMSQTLYRQSTNVTVMSGGDRVRLPLGGLGGMEAVAVDDASLVKLIADLKGLKSPTRLEPGKYRVLFGPYVAGVIAHEAFGHAQEADTCARGRSKAWELHQTGDLVGNKHATILNNPAIFENADDDFAAWGSYYFDEEGWLAEEQVLLDQGKLMAPMTNLTSALRLDIPRTANGKRESWANGVYTRQTNTYFSAGDKTLEQLMTQMGDGFVGMHPAGGMEDPKGMGIQVGVAYLEEVKNGKLTGRIFKGPAGGDIQMTGYTPDVLNSILDKSKVEVNSAAPDRARFPSNDPGGCGKYHKEIVFAGCGGPYILLDQVILG